MRRGEERRRRDSRCGNCHVDENGVADITFSAMLRRLLGSALLVLGRVVSAQDGMTPDNLNSLVESVG